MLLTVRGQWDQSPIEAQILYTSQGKSWLNAQKQKRAYKRAPQRSVEPFFHFRKRSQFKSVLRKLKFIPYSATLSPPVVKNIEDLTYKKERFLNLQRLQGKVAYAISHSPQHGGLWIEQDQFVIQKIVFGPKSPYPKTITAENYRRYPRNLYFPQTRTLSWNEKTIKITLKKVTALSKSKKLDKHFSPHSLETPNQWAGLNDLKDFYIYER